MRTAYTPTTTEFQEHASSCIPSRTSQIIFVGVANAAFILDRDRQVKLLSERGGNSQAEKKQRKIVVLRLLLLLWSAVERRGTGWGGAGWGEAGRGGARR